MYATNLNVSNHLRTTGHRALIFNMTTLLEELSKYTKLYDLDPDISLTFDIVTKFNIVWQITCALRCLCFTNKSLFSWVEPVHTY